MRRKIPYRVCRCLPDGTVTHLEARLLRQMVNDSIHPLRCAASCKRKYLKGMRLGDLCAETGHFLWAMRVWNYTRRLIEAKDWDDWRYVCFHTQWVCLSDVVSETECELLLRRVSDLWKALGHPEMACWDEQREHLSAVTFGSYYQYLWLDKYDCDPAALTLEYEAEVAAYEAEQATARLFSDALGT